MKALVLVDLQYDFMPGGALAVPEGDAVVAVARRLAPAFEVVVATQDWHPPDHGSFAANHPGRAPGEVIDLLEFTVVPDAWYPDEASAPERDEWAVHIAMTLYAVHQQSRGERMHQRGRGLGVALRSLHPGDQNTVPEPLVRRFRMLGTADNLAELTHHLRGAVQLLRAGGAPLDYGVLADQLVAWQRGDQGRVQLTWGRQFYRTRRSLPAS